MEQMKIMNTYFNMDQKLYGLVASLKYNHAQKIKAKSPGRNDEAMRRNKI